MLHCKNISAVAVSPARLAYFSQEAPGRQGERSEVAKKEKPPETINLETAALDVAEKGIAADAAAEDAAKEAKVKGGAKLDYAARAIFDSGQEDLKKAVDDVRVTEQLLGKIDPSLLREEGGLKAYERILGFTPSDKERHAAIFPQMVSLAIKDLQRALKVNPDGRFGGETLGALLRQGENEQAPDSVRNAYAHLQISPVTAPDTLLAKIDSGRAGKTAGVGLTSVPLTATIEADTALEASALGATVEATDLQPKTIKYNGHPYTLTPQANGDLYVRGGFDINSIAIDLLLDKNQVDSIKKGGIVPGVEPDQAEILKQIL